MVVIMATEWISVKDRLPELGQYVIAMECDGEIYKLKMKEKSSFFWDVDEMYYTQVTHWMPLPEPPKE
jgi:hypothetical protein